LRNLTLPCSQAHIKTEITSSVAFGTNGYRSNCNNIPFQEVLTVNHATRAQAWFKQVDTPKNFTLSATNYFASGPSLGLWSGYGAAATTAYFYQFAICDAASNFSPGLFFSGYFGNCYKQCNSWCGDVSSNYFRVDSSVAGFSGVAWNENGHRDVASKLVSYGVRVAPPSTVVYSSCMEILAADSKAPNGFYTVRPPGSSATVRVYCEYAL
jgi:hypothetical protein